MSQYDGMTEVELATHLAEKLDAVNTALAQQRTPSKASLIGPGPSPGADSTDGAWIRAIINASSRDAERQAEGKAALAELGVAGRQDAYGKATLGDSDAAGGYLVPNNQVADVVQVASTANPLRAVLNTVSGVRGEATDIPFTGAPTRATVVARGDTKENSGLVLGNYTATLYTLARIYDVSNQLLRHSSGAAERLVRTSLTKAIAHGEAWYIVNGTGTNEPNGLITALDAAPAALTTTHTAADNTVAGSVRAAIVKAIKALAARDYSANAVLLNPGDAAHAMVQGADTAGFWDAEVGEPFGLRIVTTTAVPTQHAVVGDFTAATLFVGDNFRIDTSSEAGDRWDKNLTGFRGEEEIAFNADPPVLAGAFQLIEGLIP